MNLSDLIAEAVAEDALAKAEAEGKRGSPSDEELAQWALESYPERGDAAFVVHSTPTTGGVASVMWESLRSYFVSRPFLRAIGSALADLEDASSVSIANQERANRIWSEHAEAFLRAMWYAHDRGREPFHKDDAVLEWLRQHPTVGLSPARRPRRSSR